MYPIERLTEEHLVPLPQGFAWERFATEERKVTWNGYVSYDGMLYGLPGERELAGKYVQVCERRDVLMIWPKGEQVLGIEKRERKRVQGNAHSPALLLARSFALFDGLVRS